MPVIMKLHDLWPHEGPGIPSLISCTLCLTSCHNFILKKNKLEYSRVTFSKKITFNLRENYRFLSCGRWKVTLGLALWSSWPIYGGGVFCYNIFVVLVREEEHCWGWAVSIKEVSSVHQRLKTGHLTSDEIGTLFCLLNANSHKTNIFHFKQECF